MIRDEVELAIVFPAIVDQIGDADGRASARLCGPAHSDFWVTTNQALHCIVVQFVVAAHAQGIHPGRLIPDLEVPMLSHLLDAVALFQVLHQGRHQIHPAIPVLRWADVRRNIIVPMQSLCGFRRERGRREANLHERPHAGGDDRIIHFVEARPVVHGLVVDLGVDADVAVQNAVESHVLEAGKLVTLSQRALDIAAPGGLQYCVRMIGGHHRFVESIPGWAGLFRVDADSIGGLPGSLPRRAVRATHALGVR